MVLIMVLQHRASLASFAEKKQLSRRDDTAFAEDWVRFRRKLKTESELHTGPIEPKEGKELASMVWGAYLAEDACSSIG